jgi:hypothetical protein
MKTTTFSAFTIATFSALVLSAPTPQHHIPFHLPLQTDGLKAPILDIVAQGKLNLGHTVSVRGLPILGNLVGGIPFVSKRKAVVHDLGIAGDVNSGNDIDLKPQVSSSIPFTCP